MHEALARLGVPDERHRARARLRHRQFHGAGPEGQRFIGVELDSISGRIARALHPEHDIRIENFRDTQPARGSIDAVIGNVPFADVQARLSRPEAVRCTISSSPSRVDALKPGGVLALVTSHYTLDKQNAAIREYLAEQGRFPGSDPPAVGRLQTRRHRGRHRHRVLAQACSRAGSQATPIPTGLPPARLRSTAPTLPINRYFLNHPDMVLGNWSRKDTLYGGEGFSVIGNGDLAGQLDRQPSTGCPKFAARSQSAAEMPNPPPPFTPPPPERHIAEGSFFIGDDKVIHQVEDGQAVPVIYGGTLLKADGTMTGKRLAALVGLRDLARRVLQSQNEGWPEANRNDARRELNRAYDLFVSQLTARSTRRPSAKPPTAPSSAACPTS